MKRKDILKFVLFVIGLIIIWRVVMTLALIFIMYVVNLIL